MYMKKKGAEKDNSERWMLSYLDFITLLMIFFIIMYASSNVDQHKYEQLSTSLAQGFHMSGDSPINGTGSILNGTGGFVNLPNVESGMEEEENTVGTSETGQQANDTNQTDSQNNDLSGTKDKLDSLINSSDLKTTADTSIEERGLVISFDSNLFFDSGKADIKEDIKAELINIAAILNEVDHYIRVEGHTDNVGINTAKYSSNWQLSSARAVNVVQFLIEQGHVDPTRLSAVGYGEYRPIASNDTEEGRAKNRRVDILILSSRYQGTESQ
jgi:chemotaxis protein MotB